MLFRKQDKKIHQEIALTIPSGFREMTLAEKAARYLFQDRMPQEVFTNDAQDVVIGIRHTKDAFAIDQLEEYKQNAFDKTFNTPTNKNYQSSIIKAQETPCILMSYILPSDEPLFMMNLVTSHKKMMLLLSFSCPENDEKQWKSTIEEIFKNVQIDTSTTTNEVLTQE